jgi:hypothetical protein
LCAAGLVLAACGGDALPVVSPSPGTSVSSPGGTIQDLNAQESQLFAQAEAAASAAGCGDVQTVPSFSPEELDRAHIGGPGVPTHPPLSAYASTPPASGPHDPVPLSAGIYSNPPPVAKAIHSLEHAAAIVWWSPVAGADPEQDADFTGIQEFFLSPSQHDHVIVAPYDYPDQGAAGTLPEGAGMALVAWHRLQLCDRLSLPVAFAFVLRYRFDPLHPDRYQGEAPEPGVAIG